MIDISSEDIFDDWESVYKKERFINELLSSNLKFYEAMNYSKYLSEETEYITMHKTKGSSIQNVIVVMDEFFWNEYKFSSLYLPESDTNTNRVSMLDRFYHLLSKVYHYRTVKKLRAKLVLIVPVISETNAVDLSLGGRGTSKERFFKYFAPAIKNNLLEIVELDVSDADIEKIKKEI